MFICEKIIFANKRFFLLKYIRYTSSLSYKQLPDTNNSTVLRIKKLSEILGCSKHTATLLINKNRDILALNSEEFIRSATFCSKYLKVSDVIEVPKLLSLSSCSLQHRYFSFYELGCSHIDAASFLRFSKFIKRIPGELNKYGISFHPSRDLNYFLDFLSNSDVDYKNEVKQRLEKMYQDGSSLEKIKETMNAEFLAYKLNCSLYKAYQLLEKYPPLKQQSISVMSRVIDILFEQLHLSVTKIYNTPKLLSLCPETTERVLKKFPKVLGVKIEELVQMQPLLLIRTDTIGELEKILQKFDISHKQFLCCSKIINLHSEIIEERLTSLCSSKEFSVLKSNKKFLWLVYHYERLNHRLEALKAVNLPYSIGIFTTSNKSFQGCLSKSSYFANVNEIADYLGDTLNMCNEEIKYNLKEHPNVQTACLFNAAHVVNFLLNVGVSKQQIRNGLAIILYNVDNVKLCFESLPTDTLCQPYNEWVSHYNFLQLVIYVLEKSTYLSVAYSPNTSVIF